MTTSSVKSHSESDIADRLHIPPEIVDQILHHCRNDLPTLKASSVVDRSFCEMSQKQIFHTFTLRLDDQVPDTSAKLVMLLDSSPHLSNCIRALHIHLPPQNARHLYWDGTDTPHILPRLQKLASISLIANGSPAANSSVIWTTLESKFRIALLDAFRSPLISSINLTRVRQFPIVVFASCSSLKHLSFLPVDSFSDEPPPASNVLTTLKPKLTSLVMKEPWLYLPRLGRPEYMTLATAIDLRHLQIFAFFSHKTGGPDLVNDFLQVSSTCLEELIVYLRCPDIYTSIYTKQPDRPPKPHISSPLHTGTLFKLTTLVIKTSISTAYTPEGRECSNPIPWVLGALEALPEFPSNSLSTFTLYIQFQVDSETFSQLDWEDFGRILLAPNLSGLRKVQLCVSGNHGPLETALEDLLKEDSHLSKLIGKKLLTIKNSGPLYGSLPGYF